MFERYTEKGAPSDLFARYEASQFGAPASNLSTFYWGSCAKTRRSPGASSARPGFNRVNSQGESRGRTLLREKISTSVELPLAPGNQARPRLRTRGKATACNTATSAPNISCSELLREERSMAAEILYERGLRLNAVRDEIARQSGADARTSQKKDTPHLVEFSRDLTDDAATTSSIH
jgi:ATP-dependent Clp protease ATP-binding subunit ClpC